METAKTKGIRIDPDGLLLPVLVWSIPIPFLVIQFILAPRVIPQYMIYRLDRAACLLFYAVLCISSLYLRRHAKLILTGAAVAVCACFFIEAVTIFPRIYEWNDTISLFVFLNIVALVVITSVCSFRCRFPGPIVPLVITILYEIALYRRMADMPTVFLYLTVGLTVSSVIIFGMLARVQAGHEVISRLYDEERYLNRELALTKGRLLEKEKAFSLSLLTAGIAHEINNPINYLSGNLSFLKRDFEGLLELTRPDTFAQEIRQKIGILADDFSQIVAEYEYGFRAISDVVRNLKQLYARSDTDFSPLSVREILDRTLYFFRLTYNAKAYTLTDTLPEDLRIMANSTDLHAILSNVLKNAYEAIDAGGTIRISGRYENERGIIEIEDDGCGIPTAELDRIFDPFYSTKSGDEENSGMGLGLALCREILTDSGGEIRIESEEGRYTKVIIEAVGA